MFYNILDTRDMNQIDITKANLQLNFFEIDEIFYMTGNVDGDSVSELTDIVSTERDSNLYFSNGMHFITTLPANRFKIGRKYYMSGIQSEVGYTLNSFAEALDLTDKINIDDVDQTFNSESENAQSGIAVAEAIEPFDRAYELIETITTTEQINKLTLNTEPNGTPYNFKKLFMKYSLPQVTTRPWFTFRVGSDSFGEYMGHADYKTYYCFETKVENGLICADFSYHTNGYINRSNVWICMARNIRSMPIDSFVIQGDIPANTTFEIWGVRA